MSEINSLRRKSPSSSYDGAFFDIRSGVMVGAANRMFTQQPHGGWRLGCRRHTFRAAYIAIPLRIRWLVRQVFRQGQATVPATAVGQGKVVARIATSIPSIALLAPPQSNYVRGSSLIAHTGQSRFGSSARACSRPDRSRGCRKAHRASSSISRCQRHGP